MACSWLRAGLWYANAGPYAGIALISVIVPATPGFVLLARTALRAPPSHERRQLRSVLVANLVTYAGLSRRAAAWHIGVFPLGWLLSGLGSVLVVRALIFEDLLRVRAIDDTAPRVLLHLVLAIVLGWVVARPAGFVVAVVGRRPGAAMRVRRRPRHGLGVSPDQPRRSHGHEHARPPARAVRHPRPRATRRRRGRAARDRHHRARDRGPRRRS